MGCTIEEFYKKPVEWVAIWSWISCLKMNGFDMPVESMIVNYKHYTKSQTGIQTLKSQYYRMDRLYNEILKNESSD